MPIIKADDGELLPQMTENDILQELERKKSLLKRYKEMPIDQPSSPILSEELSTQTPIKAEVAVPQNIRSQEPEEVQEDLELQGAQNLEGLGRLGSLFGGALAKIGTGYAAGNLGAKPISYDQKSIEDAGKLAGISKEQLLERRKQQEATSDRERKLLELKEIKEASLPGTEKAKRTYEYVKTLAKRLGEPSPPENLSSKEYSEYINHLEKAESIRARQAERSASLFLKNQALQEQIDKKSRLSDKQVADLSSQQAALDELEGIMSEKEKFDTGPVAGRFHGLASTIGIEDPKKAGFKRDVQDMLATYIHKMSGAAVTPQERKSLEKVMPNLNQKDDVFMENANKVRAKLRNILNRELEGLKHQGKDISPYKKELEEKASEIETLPKERKVKLKNGKIVVVDQNNRYLRDAE